jgi:enhancer of polycomb-like protein
LDEAQHQPVAQKLRRKKNIPIPVTLDVPSYEDEVAPNFTVPTSYVRFQNVPSPNDDAKIELDMELAEIKWLKYHPKYGENGDPRYQISLETLAKMLDVLEKASAIINPNIITLPEAEEVFAKQLGMVKTPLNRVTVDVYNYWSTKRQQLKRPLLRKYWPQTPLNDTNPHLVFRPREKERYKLRKHRKNDMDGYRKLQQLRGDFERVRHLLDLVKRREQLKRLEIKYMDEMRTQAVFELTDRSGTVRKPVIPVEDDADRLKKKKKKKKGLRRGDEDSASNGTDPDPIGQGEKAKNILVGAAAQGITFSGTASGGVTTTSASPSGIDNFRMPTFMDYDTSENYSMRDEKDVGLSEPYYPSYPMPSSHLLATVFSQPPKYRCRGRIGRGGRLVIDRIPVPGSRYFSPTETAATSREFSKKVQDSSAATGALQSVGAGATPSLGEAINSGHHAAILVHETAFRPLANKMDSVTDTRLQEIYAMSDSEDELMEPLTSSVYESASSRKSSSNGAKMAGAQPARAIKYALTI